MKEALSEKTVSKNPFHQFEQWYNEHLAQKIAIPEAVFLGTASEDGKVSVRTVLMKDYGDTGFTFYTNYNSKKGIQLGKNNQAALLFYWPESNRQVRIEGVTEKVEPVVSDAYFETRPRESQIGSWASPQSSEISDRECLEENFTHYKSVYSGVSVPRPPHWGGYRIIPDWFEFWEDRENRLHDRITYTRKGAGWNIARLAP
ncbi:MAG TPA: pyridoxamine 5'-phosphate oxidase [Bacteroidales bacterium]|nr:pyridoxamine 5'-phosphate oxidase [Bacteroidales bacterium]